jgi:hypothetical protein
MAQITGDDIQAMVSHWLEVPENGYLGSSYGSNIRALLQRPQVGDRRYVDAFLDKLRTDVPVLQALPAGAVSLYAEPKGPDQLHIVLDVAGRTYDLNELI